MSKPSGQTVSLKRQYLGDWSRLAKTYAAGTVVAAHAHSAGQLLFITQGVLLVEAQSTRWTIPPQQALWLPPGQMHGFYAASTTVLRAVYLEAAWLTDVQIRFPRLRDVHAIAVSALLKELVLGLFDPRLDSSIQRDILSLVLDVLPRMANLPTDLPMPQSENLMQATQAVLTRRAWNHPLHMIAAMAHMSERSFTRNFKLEVGLSYRAWRQRARLIVSLDLLNAQHSVKHIAHELGFSSSAAYVAAFNQWFGLPPAMFAGRKGSLTNA